MTVTSVNNYWKYYTKDGPCNMIIELDLEVYAAYHRLRISLYIHYQGI